MLLVSNPKFETLAQSPIPGTCSAIQFGRDDVQASQDGHDISDQVIADDVGKIWKWMNEGGRVRVRQAVWLPSVTR